MDEPKTLAEACEMLAKARRFWRAVADLLHMESNVLRELLASMKRKSA